MLRRLRGIRGLVGLALLVLAGAVGHRVADIVRGTPVAGVVVVDSLPPPGSPVFTREAAAAAQVTLSSGNRVRILLDEDLFRDMLGHLRRARQSILLYSYYCQPGRLGDQLADVLAAQARGGVRVFLLGDGFGCREYLNAVGPRLRSAGVRVAAHRPVRWWQLHRAQHRNHGRVVLVDGTVGYTGGFGIADDWVGGEDTPPWRDTNLRIRGPAVAELEAAFTAAWSEATGNLLVLSGEAEPRPMAADPEFPDVLAGLLVSRPGLGVTTADRYLAYSMSGATRTLYVANSYFVPTARTRRMLADAARRGVDVRVLVPGPVNDVPGTRWAGQLHFDELLEAGVRIWLYQGTMMHAKTMVVDGRWGTVGSLNLDNRSLRLNEEWSVVFDDPGLGAALDSLFLADLERSRERTVQEHAARSLWDRVRERLAWVIEPLL